MRILRSTASSFFTIIHRPIDIIPNILFFNSLCRTNYFYSHLPLPDIRIFSSNNAFLTDYLSFVSVTKSPKSEKIKKQNIPHRKEVLNMRKKIWKILPLVTGLVLLTASSALTVHGESDNTIDVTLFKLCLLYTSDAADE